MATFYETLTTTISDAMTTSYADNANEVSFSYTSNNYISTAGPGNLNTTLDMEKLRKTWKEIFDNLYIGSYKQDKPKVQALFRPNIEPGVIYAAASVFGGLGIVGNAWLLCMSLQADLRGFSYSTYLFWASIVDSVSLVLVYSNAVMQMKFTTMYAIINTLPSCIIMNLVSKTASSMSPWIMVVFAVDRFVAIVFPLKRRVVCTVRNARIISAVLLALCVIQSIPAITRVQIIRFLGQDMCAEMVDDGISIWITVTMFLNTTLPCLCLFYLNTHTLIAIKRGMVQRQQMTRTTEHQQTHRQPAQGPGTQRASGNCRQTEANAMQREMMNMTKALLTLPCFTFLALIPYTITNCVFILQFVIKPETHKETEPDPNMQFAMNAEIYCRLFYSSSFACSFYLLMITSRPYRQIAKNMIRRCTTPP